MALRSARARGRAGFFFKLVLALVARGWFFLLVKRLALRAGQRQSWFFKAGSRAGGAGAVFSFGQMALRSARATEAELVFSLSWFSRWWRGQFSLSVKWLCAPRGPRGRRVFRIPLPTSGLHSPTQRVKGCSRLNNSKDEVKNGKKLVAALNAFSRFSNLLLCSRLYALAERKVLRKRNTIGGAVNRRSPKNAFSEAASIFGLRQLLRGLKGASSP